MDDIVLLHVVKRYQQLDRETPDQANADSLKIVALDELIQVHTEHLKREDQVLPKDKLLLDSDDVFLIFGVVIAQLVQDFGFNQTLLIESLFVSQNLKSDSFALLVVIALEDLAEGAFT